jgi:hypothetical protein
MRKKDFVFLSIPYYCKGVCSQSTTVLDWPAITTVVDTKLSAQELEIGLGVGNCSRILGRIKK